MRAPDRFSAEDAFWLHVDRRDEDECWPWLGRLQHGYGRFRVAGQLHQAHRWAYELLIGPIPTGLVIDHDCHNRDPSCLGGDACPHRACTNPAHMTPRTIGQNVARGRRHGKFWK